MPPHNRRESYRANHFKQSVFTQPGPITEVALISITLLPRPRTSLRQPGFSQTLVEPGEVFRSLNSCPPEIGKAQSRVQLTQARHRFLRFFVLSAESLAGGYQNERRAEKVWTHPSRSGRPRRR